MAILGAGSAGASVSLICAYFDEALISRLSFKPAMPDQERPICVVDRLS
jgi:hypothetical protein